MASLKQVHFIENLMREREIYDNNLYNSLEAQAVRCGHGEDLSVDQASRFIEILLETPIRSDREAVDTTGMKPAGTTVNHSKFGKGQILSIEDGSYLIQFEDRIRKIANGYV